MKFELPDMTVQDIARIAAPFQNDSTEMLAENHSTPEKKVYKRAINSELLKQMFSPDVVDGDGAYEFTWASKKAAIVEADPQNVAPMRGGKQRSGHHRPPSTLRATIWKSSCFCRKAISVRLK